MLSVANSTIVYRSDPPCSQVKDIGDWEDNLGSLLHATACQINASHTPHTLTRTVPMDSWDTVFNTTGAVVGCKYQRKPGDAVAEHEPYGTGSFHERSVTVEVDALKDV